MKTLQDSEYAWSNILCAIIPLRLSSSESSKYIQDWVQPWFHNYRENQINIWGGHLLLTKRNSNKPLSYFSTVHDIGLTDMPTNWPDYLRKANIFSLYSNCYITQYQLIQQAAYLRAHTECFWLPCCSLHVENLVIHKLTLWQFKRLNTPHTMWLSLTKGLLGNYEDQLSTASVNPIFFPHTIWI